jgi:ABC-type transport system involved in cytochrome c biogenesis ATPase subunit
LHNPLSSKHSVLIRAERLGFSYPGLRLLEALSFDIRPGLTLVRGGDGRGKSTLLRLLAGVQVPMEGAVHRPAASLFWDSAADAADDGKSGLQWLAERRARYAAWDDALQSGLIDAFGLAEHIGKPLYMLSTGSRRKVGLVAAAACRAQVTLLDTPYAALDAGSGRVLSDILADAADLTDRAWIVADHEQPPGLAGITLSQTIDLGD